MVFNSIGLLKRLNRDEGKMLLFIIEVAAPVSIRQFTAIPSIESVAMGNSVVAELNENFGFGVYYYGQFPSVLHLFFGNYL